MVDKFADGWMEFQMLVDRLRTDHNLTIQDIEQYFKMYIEAQE